MNRFDPPGFLDDLTEAQKAQWSQTVSGWLDRARAGNPAYNDGPRGQFFNPLTNPPAADPQVAVIAWNAFPRQVKSSSLSDKLRWRRADSDRNLQDEYCEWSVTRDPVNRKITSVSFTTEGPEYWQELAKMNPEKVLDLYRKFISPTIKRSDLFKLGKYDPRNRFNNSTSRGAMHLIQPANTLRAEIELGAAATIRRIRNGAELTGAQELILCSGYGEPGRNSDPFIGEQVNSLARQKADITINNPVGLYLHEFNPVGWTTPDGEDPRKFWKFLRGKDNHFVRAVFEVPPGRGYVVGDIKSAGKLIEFGAQIVDFITIKLEGLATRVGQSSVAPFQGCLGAAQPPAPGAPPSLLSPMAAPLYSRASAERTQAVVAAAGPPSLMPTATGADTEAEVENELVARLPEELQSGHAAAAATAAPAALIPYPKLPPEHFATRNVSGKIMAYASPDSTYAVTKKLLDSAYRSIVIGIYDFHADYVKETLKKAMRRGVQVSLMLDTNSADEHSLFAELRELGATCVKAPSSSAGSTLAYFGNAHEKIIVVDGEIVMIQSGNWSENSIPFNEGDGVIVGEFEMGNRDMGLALHSPELATFFADLVARDMRLAQGEPPSALPPSVPAAVASPASGLFFEAAPPDVPVRLFSSLTVTPSSPVRVTPVVTPENFHDTAKEFLRSATTSIRIEQQYIRGSQAAIAALLEEIAAARSDNPELDIRIIVSPKYLYGTEKQKFVQAMQDFELEFDTNYRYLSARHFVHCHNKLIVVDDKVLLGSQNFSTTGVLTNREASVLVEHSGIANYFSQIFDADWEMSEPAAPPDGLFAAAVDGIVEPADFAEGGVVISSISDYKDV